jgi:hypothetical protein
MTCGSCLFGIHDCLGGYVDSAGEWIGCQCARCHGHETETNAEPITPDHP